MLVDSHCHLDFPELAGRLDQVLADMATHEVGHALCVCVTLTEFERVLEVAARDARLSASVGVHPDYPDTVEPDVETLVRLAAHPKVVAIGETGLDYYHPAPDGWTEQAFRERQRDFLRAHFELAAECGLNVVIHTRDRDGHASFEDALAIYRGYHARARAVFHCFIGPMENARRVIDLGGLVSFGGVATFKNAREVRATAMACPAGAFMVETDAPYLAPEPHRGKRNVPAFVRDTAEFLAAARGEGYEEFIRHTGATASEFFRFRSGAN